MTTYTIFGNANDNHIRSRDASYATARAGGGTLFLEIDGPTKLTFGQAVSLGQPAVYESFLQFDNSVIDAGETVSEADLNLYGTDDLSTTDFTIQARVAPGFGATVDTGDWVPGADLSGDTLLAEFATSGGFSTVAYNTFSDVAMASAVDAKGSAFQITITSSRTAAGNAPSGNEYARAYSVDQTGTDNDPYLDVTAAAAGGGGRIMSSLANHGGLAGAGGIAGPHGGLAG
jgi:hypothetical protein